MAVVPCMHVEEVQWAGRGPCDMHSVHVPAGRPVGDVAVIADALDEGRPQMTARPCSGRVSGLRVGMQRGVSADGQRKQPHPLKDREEGILRQSRYRKALGLLIVSVQWCCKAKLCNRLLMCCNRPFMCCNDCLCSAVKFCSHLATWLTSDLPHPHGYLPHPHSNLPCPHSDHKRG